MSAQTHSTFGLAPGGGRRREDEETRKLLEAMVRTPEEKDAAGSGNSSFLKQTLNRLTAANASQVIMDLSFEFKTEKDSDETFTEAQRALGFGPRSPWHLLRPGELRATFEGFEILFYEEAVEVEAVARLVARAKAQP